MSEALTIHTYPWETIKAQALLDENAALRREIERLTAVEQNYSQIGLEHAATVLSLRKAHDKTVQDLQSQLAQVEGELHETWKDERDEVWRRPTAWAYAQTCRALHQAEQEREAIRARYERQCASVHRLMQENAELQARLDALLDHDKGPAVDSPHGN